MHRETLEEDYEFEVEKTRDGGYSVRLPHQCDSWEVLGADLGSEDTSTYTYDYPNLPKNKEASVRQMELFVKRAQEALEKLKLL